MPKNKIILFEGIGKEKRMHVLYDFTKVDHAVIEGRSYVRVLCGSKYYYFKTCITTISEITVY